jgi:cytochrome P450
MFCSGHSHQRLLELHDKYGGIVRIGPNELSYTVPQAWDAIMGRRKGSVENAKAPWYCPAEGKEITGAPYSDHVRMRRVLGPAFSASAMMEQQPIIKGHIDLLIERLHKRSQDGRAAINIAQWYNYCSFDIIGDLAFGEPFGCLQDAAMHPWIAWIFANNRLIAVGIALNRFPLLRVVLPWLAPKSLRDQAEDLKRLSREKVAKRLEDGRDRPDFIQAMVSGKGDAVRISTTTTCTGICLN